MQLSLYLLRSFQQQNSFFYSNYDMHDQKNKQLTERWMVQDMNFDGAMGGASG